MSDTANVLVQAGPSRRERQADPLEARLAMAEKEVALALDTSDHEELIALATEALNAKSEEMAPSKAVIKSRKNLLWARSHTYHQQNLHELALKDAKAALKLDPEDTAAYLRAATLLSSTGHKAQAFSCLNRAQSLCSKYDSATRALWLWRIDKHRRKLSGTERCLVERLPNEILVEVALYLDMPDRTLMSQVCSSWRHTLTSASCLWSSITLNKIGKKLGPQKAEDLLLYIIMRVQRANYALQTIIFEDIFPFPFLKQVYRVLRAFSKSLHRIQIPCNNYKASYDELYRHCPQLKCLVLSSPRGRSMPLSRFDSDMSWHIPTVDESVEEKGAERFFLEEFSVDENWFPCELSRHFHKLRVLKGHNPFVFVKQLHHTSFDHEQMVRGLIEHLEEWVYCHSFPSGSLLSQPVAATFPKLKRLASFQLSSEFPIKLTCPNLLDFQIIYNGIEAEGATELARMLTTSPKLRKLQIRPFDFSRAHSQICRAMSGLHDLEWLDLGLALTESELVTLLAPQNATSGLSVPFPKLHTLIVKVWRTDLTMLTSALLAREYLRTGHAWETARQMATELVTRPIKHVQVVTPFQRGSRSVNATVPAENSESPRLKDAPDCTRLRRLEVSVADADVPKHLLLALDSVVDDLVITFEPI